MTLRNRIYLSMGLIVLTSFLIIGAITVWYTSYENEKYHLERLDRKEKAIEKALKYYFERHQNDSLIFYTLGLHNEIQELSDIHNLDINLYNLDGRLVTASDFGFVDAGFIPENFGPELLNRLKTSGGVMIQEEFMKGDTYLIAIKYIRTESGAPAAIIHIPYYRSEKQFREETWLFLQALAQVYAIMFIIGLVVAYLLSNSITRGLKNLEEKISRLSIRRENHEVEWDSKDEIGSLVEAYNRKVRELESSVDKLAEQEREGAWREMAKQVAHEIKNPLTPMMLQVQQLKRSHDDGREDFDQRLDRFTTTMTEQIETLSRIAAEFSNFAKLPEANLQEVSVQEVVDHVAELFQGGNHTLQISSPEDRLIVLADKDQLIRVFNNLITNAFQSFEEPKGGEVDIEIRREGKNAVVQVSDNGSGIDRDKLGRIFEPNFTTKSSGTGLGLAMVKSIVNNLDGKISVISEKGVGTSIIINLPLVNS